MSAVRRAAFAAALLLGGVPALGAQQPAPRVTLVFQDVPAGEALDRLVAATGMSLVYDASLIGRQRVFCRADGWPAEEVLRCIVREAGLDFYRLSSGTYVVIASAADAPRYASLAGIVVDAASGEPLPAARVTLDAPGAMREAGEGGLFSFARLSPGRYRLRVQAIGYRPSQADVDVPPSGTVRQRVTLARQPLQLDPLVVNGITAPAPARPLGQEAIDPDSSSAATGPDALLRGASSQLGVAQRALLGDLHIQGGESGEHQFRLDGVPVFDPVSLGRLFGAFSPLAIDRLTIRKAGFGASYGSYGAGVVDLEQRVGSGTTAEAVGTADPYSVSGRITAPGRIGGHALSTMVAARTSLWSVFPSSPLQRTLREWTSVDRLLLDRFAGTSPSLPVTAGFTPTGLDTQLGFTDIHAAARLELGAFRSLSGSFYLGDNRVGTDLLAVASPAGLPPTSLASSDHYRWREIAAQLRHDWLLSARATHTLQLRVSSHRLRHEERALFGVSDSAALATPAPHEGNGVSELALVSNVTYAIGGGSEAEGGVELARTASDMTMQNGVYRAMRSGDAAFRGAAFGQLRRRLGSHLTLESGLRLTWVPSRDAVYAEPRLSLRGEHAGTGGEFGWRVATGLYRQFVNQFEVASVGPSALVPETRFWLPVDGSLAPPKAYHLAGEAVWRSRGGLELRAEGYYKWQPSILALDYAVLLDRSATLPAQLAQADFIATSRGTAYGAGVRAGRTFGVARLEVGYDYGYSRRTFPARFGGLAQPTPWNEPHRALVTLDVTPARSLMLSLRARGIWGRTWALRQAYYELLTTGPGVPAGLPIGLPGNDALPAVYEADLGANWSTRIGGARVTFGAALLNALGRQNVMDQWLQPQADGAGGVRYVPVPRAMLGRQPMVTVRIGQ